MDADPRLSPATREAVQDSADTVCVGAATAWETASKFRPANWPGAQAFANDLARMMFALSFEPLPLDIDPHGDPFDRVLQQAESEDIPLVTADPAFRHFNVPVLW